MSSNEKFINELNDKFDSKFLKPDNTYLIQTIMRPGTSIVTLSDKETILKNLALQTVHLRKLNYTTEQIKKARTTIAKLMYINDFNAIVKQFKESL